MLKTKIRCPGGRFSIEKCLILKPKITKLPKTFDFLHFYAIFVIFSIVLIAVQYAFQRK